MADYLVLKQYISVKIYIIILDFLSHFVYIYVAFIGFDFYLTVTLLKPKCLDRRSVWALDYLNPHIEIENTKGIPSNTGLGDTLFSLKSIRSKGK